VSETKVKAVKVPKVKSAEGKAVYEVGYLVMPSVSLELLPREVDAIRSIIEKVGGEIISEGAPEMRPLAYTMIKVIGATHPRFDAAYFGWIKFEATKESIGEVKKVLDGIEKIVRFLLIETVRENTLYGAKILKDKEESDKPEVVKAPVAVVRSSEEEIDKAVEKLIA
jgi:ribosomal protein S6